MIFAEPCRVGHSITTPALRRAGEARLSLPESALAAFGQPSLENVARLLTRLPELGGGFLDFRPIARISPPRSPVAWAASASRTGPANIGDELDEQLGCGPIPLATLSHEQAEVEGRLVALDDVLGGVTGVDVERGGKSSLRPQAPSQAESPAIKGRHARQRIELERLLGLKPVRDRAAQSAQNVGVRPPEHAA